MGITGAKSRGSLGAQPFLPRENSLEFLSELNKEFQKVYTEFIEVFFHNILSGNEILKKIGI